MSWECDLALAKEYLAGLGLRLVIVKDGETLWQSDSERVTELLAYARQATLDDYGACMADRIVGKAAALLAHLAGIRALYTPIVSEPAHRYLQSRGIYLEHDGLVPAILNEQGTDLCPLERLMTDIDDPEQAPAEISRFYALDTM